MHYHLKDKKETMNFKNIRLTHSDHQVPYSLLKRALQMIDSSDKKGQHVVDFKETVGFNDLVCVTDDDEFYEKVRGNRPYPSRFVKNKLPVETSKLTVVWRRVNEDIIHVITAYFTDSDDPYCPDEPANLIRKIEKGISISKTEMQASLEFWSTHAFVESIPMRFLK